MLYAYAHDRLEDAEARRIAAHLEACARCREDAQALREIDQILRRTLTAHAQSRPSAAPQVLAKIESGVSGSLRRVSRQHVRPVRQSARPLVAVAVLAVMLAALLLLGVWREPPALELVGRIDDPLIKVVTVYVDERLYRTVEVEAGVFRVAVPMTAKHVVVEALGPGGKPIRRSITIQRAAPK